MTTKDVNETIVKHFYNLPMTKETPPTDNYRQVTLIMPTMTIQLVSSYENESIEYLSTKAMMMLQQLRREDK